jgi:hypothetical protein
MLGLFPWEKWLPPYVFGPLICLGSACILAFCRDLSRLELAGCAFCIVFGAWGTWAWFSARRNIFDLSDPKK